MNPGPPNQGSALARNPGLGLVNAFGVRPHLNRLSQASSRQSPIYRWDLKGSAPTHFRSKAIARLKCARQRTIIVQAIQLRNEVWSRGRREPTSFTDVKKKTEV